MIPLPPEIANLAPAELTEIGNACHHLAAAKYQGQIDAVRFDLETHETQIAILRKHCDGECAKELMLYEEDRTIDVKLFSQPSQTVATEPNGYAVARASIREQDGKHVCTLLCGQGPFKALNRSEHIGDTPDAAMAAAQAAAGKVAAAAVAPVEAE